MSRCSTPAGGIPGCHDPQIEDAHNAHQRPKIETYGNSLFITAHTRRVDGHVRFVARRPVRQALRFLNAVHAMARVPLRPVRQRRGQVTGDAGARPERGATCGAGWRGRQTLPADRPPSVANSDALEHDVFAEPYKRGTIRSLYELRKN